MSTPWLTERHGYDPTSDFQPCSPPACTAQSSAGRMHRAFRLSTPRYLFSPSAGLMPWGTPQCIPTGTDSSQRPFALLERLRLSAPPLQGQSSRPAASLSGLKALLPVRPPDSATASGSPRRRLLPCPSARCRFAIKPGLPRLLPPLPFGAFGPLRINVFSLICCLPVHLPAPPDFPSLPVAVFYC